VVLRDDPAAPNSLRSLARSLDAIEGHLLSPPSDSARDEVQTETRLFEKGVETGTLWDRRCQQLERYYDEIRGELPSEWDSSPHLHRKATQPPPKGTVLRDWVDEQRQLFAQGRLDSARVERLLSTGIQLVKRNQRRRDADAVFPPAFTFTSAPSPSSMKETKARQVSALAGAAQQHFDACRRVVDVGCGRGHLTRWLSQKLGVRALGLDRDASLVMTAKRLSKTVGQLPARAHSSRSAALAAAAAAAMQYENEGNAEPQQGPTVFGTTEFEQCDVRAPGSLSRVLRSGDLVVALHPCGPLGESVVQGVVDASREGVDVKMLLVSCCLAGRGGAEVSDPRPPASLTGQRLHLQLPRTALKKANLGVFPNGNEMQWEEREEEGGREGADGGRERMHRRREARLAMRLLLEARGITVAAGREMDEVPKRSNSGTSVEVLLGISSFSRAEGAKRESSGEGRAAEVVEALANEALAARGLALLSEGEGAAVARAAAEAMPALRRLELLDVLVGDAVELSVNLDRACVLEEAGLHVSVGRLFPRSVSPRNLAIFASTTPLRTQTSPTDVRPRINVPP
jgi:SAM-dependent methyltransferase